MYFIDFDDTIFNSGKFIKDFKKVFRRHGVSSEEFEKSYIPCSEGICGKTFMEYDLERQLLDIENRHGKLTKMRRELHDFIVNSQKYVFDDFYEFTKKIPKENIFLISFGKSSFQRSKIKHSGVLSYVQDYVLTSSSKAECINEIFSRNERGERKLTFVDDRVDQLEDVKEKFPEMILYRMIRPEGRYIKAITPDNIPEINKLTDIPKR